jgi:rhamnosyltransferase
MKICTIIVTYNPEMISFSECIKSHLKSQSDKIIIVDNGSSNKFLIVESIKNYNEIKFISLDDNKGIAYAQNVGIKLAMEEKFDFVLLFDQDTILPDAYAGNIFQSYLNIAKSGAKIGVVGPNYIDTVTKKYYPQMIFKGLKFHKIFPDKKSEEFTELSFIIASGSLIKIDVLKEVGLMDESLFIDSVDIEWCFRAAAFDYKTFVANDLEVFHTIGDKRVKSLGREISIHSPMRKYYIARNHLLLLRNKAIPVGFKVRTFLNVFLSATVHMYDVKFSRKYMYLISKGIFHGIIGKKGKYK